MQNKRKNKKTKIIKNVVRNDDEEKREKNGDKNEKGQRGKLRKNKGKKK